MKLAKALPEGGVRVMADRRDFGRFVGSAKAERDGVACLGCTLSMLMFLLGAAVTAASVASDQELGTVGRFVGVGLLVLSVVVPIGTMVWQERTGPPPVVFHCFEHGFVLTHGADVRALPWSDVRVSSFRESAYAPHGGSGEAVDWAHVHDRSGALLYAASGDAAVGIAEVAAADELPRAAHRLGRGGMVSYGRFALSAGNLFLDGDAVPWREIHHVESTGHAVRVHRVDAPDRAAPFTASRRETPYAAVVVALARQYATAPHPEPDTRPPQRPDAGCAVASGPGPRPDEQPSE
ncbi:hypothetical protein [Streptomyces sp. NPDC057702]|uniref:hypothetical protein n=1 Tax=unclassified Streptomyces TaxID=2593676 RepID=UPI00369876F8